MSVDTSGNPGNGSSGDASISDDGRYVAFSSLATNLVSGDTNGTSDVFVRAKSQPVVLSVSPCGVSRGTTATLTITARDFRQPATVGLGGRITINAVSFVSETKVTVSVTVKPTAATGVRSVVLTNVGTGPGPLAGAVGTCDGCLSVT